MNKEIFIFFRDKYVKKKKNPKKITNPPLKKNIFSFLKSYPPKDCTTQRHLR